VGCDVSEALDESQAIGLAKKHWFFPGCSCLYGDPIKTDRLVKIQLLKLESVIKTL